MEAAKINTIQEKAIEQSLGLSDPFIYNKVVNILDEKAIDQGLLLDVGSGRGDFFKTLDQKPHQFSLNAVDLMYSELRGVQWFVQDLNKNLQFQNSKFNVVSCLELVEHLENPRKLVREIYRVLQPGGAMILSTPNNESWRAIISYIVRGHFVAFTDESYPAHITAINRADILHICQEAGFMNIEVIYSNRGVLPKWTNISWQSLSGNLLNGQRYSDNIFCFAQKPKLEIV